jgi:flagellar biosynthesis anti-sigma factor FlgM
MRIERKALTRGATSRKEENAGSPAAAGPGSERNQFSPEQGLPERASSDQASAEQARVSWLAAQAVPPPEIRSERIAAIQSAIANGTYAVSPEQTAEAILSERQVRDESAA